MNKTLEPLIIITPNIDKEYKDICTPASFMDLKPTESIKLISKYQHNSC